MGNLVTKLTTKHVESGVILPKAKEIRANVEDKCEQLESMLRINLKKIPKQIKDFIFADIINKHKCNDDYKTYHYRFVFSSENIRKMSYSKQHDYRNFLVEELIESEIFKSFETEGWYIKATTSLDKSKYANGDGEYKRYGKENYHQKETQMTVSSHSGEEYSFIFIMYIYVYTELSDLKKKNRKTYRTETVFYLSDPKVNNLSAESDVNNSLSNTNDDQHVDQHSSGKSKKKHENKSERKHKKKSHH